MIYKIQPDLLQFKQFTLDADEIEDKLGEDCLIFMDSRPTRYSQHWVPLQVEFFDEYPGGDKNKQIPDLFPDLLGKLFLSETAYTALAPMLENMGEFLPVSYSGKSGYLFNPLRIAEEQQAVDSAQVSRDQWGALNSIVFDETKLTTIPVFRLEADDYRGIYCGDTFKQAVENTGLKGVNFTTDLRDRPAE